LTIYIPVLIDKANQFLFIFDICMVDIKQDDCIPLCLMKDSAWATLDAYLFRIAGMALGIAGCVSLLSNNPTDELFSNPYGIAFFAMFATLGAYSTIVIAMDILASPDAVKKTDSD